ncbi:MAG TPA: endolytic transglycosylase MltG, partial [Vicinamibacterales bacterium]|nr:endolytic transglycosylase MltG [Vicinamibacterales bacterium]
MKRAVLSLVILLVLAALAVGVWSYALVQRPYKGYAEEETFVEIAPGSSPQAMGRSLADAGVVANPAAFRIAVWLRGAGRKLQAGEYRFDRAMTPGEVVDKIVRGDVFLRPVTFREGLTIRQMAAVFEERGLGSQRDFITAAANASLVREIDPDARDLEGYLFPDTYTLPRRTTAEQLIARMVARFDKALTPDIKAAAAARGLSMRELVTLASLVEKETAKPEERPLVAAVYSNRVKIGMGLQCDPTVIYALERAGRYTGNLTRADLQFDSPYNTYRYAGLPPGPIAAPGQAALEAAA